MATEIYVILFLVAMTVVIFAFRPHSSGPVREMLLAGWLSESVPAEAGVQFSCREDGMLRVTRYGLQGITMSGAVSAKVTIKGFTITIEERLTPGRSSDDAANEAIFVIDSLAQERYMIRYVSDATSTSASVTMRLLAGAEAYRPLLK